MKARLWLFPALLVVVLFAMAGCSEEGEEGDILGSHDQEMGGVMHVAGLNDPLVNCTGCHGATLGGGSGTGCYACHNADDHTADYYGTLHRPGMEAGCVACHGPSNRGGLGPACSSCHT
jgi:hypothetical protein